MPADLTYLGAFRLGRHQPLEAFGGEEGVASISWREDAGTLIVQSRGLSTIRSVDGSFWLNRVLHRVAVRCTTF